MMYRLIIILFFSTMVFSGTSFASPLHDCVYLYRHHNSIDVNLMKLLEVSKGDALKVCTNRFGDHRDYYVASHVFEKDGVCYFYLRSYIRVSGGQSWKVESQGEKTLQTSYMTLKNRECPKHWEGSYIETKGVPLGQFKALFGYYKKIEQDKNYRKEFSKHVDVQNFEEDMIRGSYRLKSISLTEESHKQGLQYQILLEKYVDKNVGVIVKIDEGKTKVISGVVVIY